MKTKWVYFSDDSSLFMKHVKVGIFIYRTLIYFCLYLYMYACICMYLSLSAYIHISNMCIFMHSNFIIDAKFTKIYLQITDICFYLILFYTYLSEPLHNHLSQYIKYNVQILLLNTLCAHIPFIKKKRKRYQP